MATLAIGLLLSRSRGEVHRSLRTPLRPLACAAAARMPPLAAPTRILEWLSPPPAHIEAVGVRVERGAASVSSWGPFTLEAFTVGIEKAPLSLPTRRAGLA